MNAEFKPHFDIQGLECFCKYISESKTYLEYGSGGSTVAAYTSGSVDNIISIDSDERWLSKLKIELNKVPIQTKSNVFTIHCNIGSVGDWGIPKDSTEFKNYWLYSSAPWNLAQEHLLNPDLILIDGRFRVASFLFSLISAREYSRILFDDYFDRPQYFEVERFCRPSKKYGRMAVFEVNKNFSMPEIVSTYAKYSTDFR
jgi:hypothetical protein